MERVLNQYFVGSDSDVAFCYLLFSCLRYLLKFLSRRASIIFQIQTCRL